MATLIQNSVRLFFSVRVFAWLVAVGALVLLLTLLTKAIMDNPTLSQDIRILDWIVGWDFWGVTTLLKIVSTITDMVAGFIYVASVAIFLLLNGKAKAAIVFTAVGATIGAVAIMGDFTLGELVDRGRPLASPEKISPAFPSGHVFAATVFFGFVSFLGIYYHLKAKFLLPMLVVFAAIVLLVGPSRVHVQAHFPSDVLAGYLLGGIWLLVIIPAFLFIEKSRWLSFR